MARLSRFEGLRTTRRTRRLGAQPCVNLLPHARPLRLEALEDRRLLAALVGVDFGALNTPPNWTQVITVGPTAAPTTRLNLSDESGAATPYDLTISNTSGATAADNFVAINAPTLPQHTQSLAAVNNIVYVDNTGSGLHKFEATFSELKPGVSYEVYVFAVEDAADGFIDRQTVTLTGGGNGGPIVFQQSPISANNLWVNDQLGSSSLPLEHYAKIVEAKSDGKIDVTVQMLENSDAVVLAGLAIRELEFVVNSPLDVDDNNATNGVTTLREAIRLANDSPGAATILFAGAMNGQTINLGGTELVISEAVTIDAAPLAANVTINANQQSRIFNIDDPSTFEEDFSVTLAGLSLTGGRTVENVLGRGGAIRSASLGLLTLTECIVSGNSTVDDNSGGGGIHAYGAVTLTGCTVTGNSTAGDNSRGGGVNAREVTLIKSTVSGNSTSGSSSSGGGIAANYGSATLTDSTVSGNNTAGPAAHGGGIAAKILTLTQSTVSGNSATASNGGGINAAALTLFHSSVSGNHATGQGGGVYHVDFLSNDPISVTGSIIAGNAAAGGSPDLKADPDSIAVPNSVSYSLIGNNSGSGVTPTTGAGNLLDINPLVGPLADNGGPTKTHALLPGSPALDRGANALTTDQRGRTSPVDLAGIANAAGGNGSDIGAYEAQVKSTADFDADGDADGSDFLAWQRGFGKTTAAVRADGNSDDDGDADHSDLAAWRSQFGATGLSLAAASESAAASAETAAVTAQSAAMIDAAHAHLYAAGEFSQTFPGRGEFRLKGRGRAGR